MLNPLVSVNDAARLLGVSKWTIFAWTKTGKLRPVRFCRRVLFEESELKRLIDDAKTPLLAQSTFQNALSRANETITTDRHER